MAVALYDAVVLARKNERHGERLRARRKKLDRHIAQESSFQEERRRAVHEQALMPFTAAFQRLKRVDLAELESVEPVGRSVVDVELRELRQVAVAAVGALAGGAVTGAGVSAAAYLAVGTFATASTGTAISSLSGAAAGSATLAWLGGGSLAAGGGGVAAGTAVLALTFTLPALVVTGALLEWRGRGARRDQQEIAEELDLAETELTEARRTLSEVFRRSRELRLVLRELSTAVQERLVAFVALVDGDDDYGSYDARQRAQVKEMFDLVCLTVTVMGAAPAGEDGRVSELSAHAVTNARARLRELAPAA
ncbi:hypothetical protein [Streptomyces sp. MZ04]|uniref:hypothetical protein n=1 Tax=Streptomyces sp. MZ04 TaxID=2559236 RepID=UPI00107EE003|nr:hypothetical protein [Streptomyces sp. MZ04]TGB10446.1 hypothetical protein E2651_14705 [Streptomyces sp. MZ04]